MTRSLVMTVAALRWLLVVPLTFAAILLTWALAPLLAATAFATEDSETREGDLPRWLRWFQTHDAPLDEVWRGSGLYLKNFPRLMRGQTSETVRRSAWRRWACRALWLWRNPAYTFRADVLGYRHADHQALSVRRWGNWEDESSSLELYWADRGGSLLTRAAWSVRGKLSWYPGAPRYLRINIGWKLVMVPIAMASIHVSFFRKWKGR